MNIITEDFEKLKENCKNKGLDENKLITVEERKSLLNKIGKQVKFAETKKKEFVKTIDVSKAVLTWCISFERNKQSYANLFDYEQSNAYMKIYDNDRVREKYIRMTGFSLKENLEPLKVKVRLKLNDSFVKIKTFGKNGKVDINDYYWCSLKYQRDEKNKETIRINLSQICLYLQDIFWFTTMTVQTGIDNQFTSEIFKERIDVFVVNEPNDDYILIEVKKVFDYNSLDKDKISVGEFCQLIDLVKKSNIATKRLELKENDKKAQKRKNKIIEAGQWKDASLFNSDDVMRTNVIYYLATKGDGNNPVKMYIGEAEVSGNRLKTMVDNETGNTIIGHAERKADWKEHKFTRYRIDVIEDVSMMHDAQDTIIGSMMMADAREFPNGFILTNDAYNVAYGEARRKRK